MSVNFRMAQISDQAAIIAIYNQAVATKGSTADLTPVTVAQRQAWFASFTPQHFPLWVIESDGACAGFVGLEPYSDRAVYRNTAEIAVYLDGQHQGQHLGTLAIDWGAEQAPQLGVTTVISRIFGHNQASRHLFEKAGYEHWGHLPAIADMQGFAADLEVYGHHF